MEHKKETYDKNYNLDRSFENDLNNRDNSLNSISSFDCPYTQLNSLSHSTLHDIRKSNAFRVIIDYININSVEINLSL